MIDTLVADCGEPLVEIATTATVTLDPRERDEHGAYGRVRTGVLERLRIASERLPAGIGLLVIEGHRSPAEQARRFALYEDRLRRAGISDPAELRRQASAFVSPVEVAPHCAGAAVDLTLIDADGAELDMGGAVNGHRTGGERWCPLSPEAAAVRSSFYATADVAEAVADSSSGREFALDGFADDVAIATELDTASVVPILADGAFQSR